MAFQMREGRWQRRKVWVIFLPIHSKVKATKLKYEGAAYDKPGKPKERYQSNHKPWTVTYGGDKNKIHKHCLGSN